MALREMKMKMDKALLVSKLDENITALTFVKVNGKIYDTIVSFDNLETWITNCGNTFTKKDFERC